MRRPALFRQRCHVYPIRGSGGLLKVQFDALGIFADGAKGRSRRISVDVIDGSAAGRIDQMQPATCETGDRLIALFVRLLRVIGDPALYAQAGLGAAVKECDHGLIMESGRDRNRAGA
jgi:hypothetical protein